MDPRTAKQITEDDYVLQPPLTHAVEVDKLILDYLSPHDLGMLSQTTKKFNKAIEHFGLLKFATPEQIIHSIIALEPKDTQSFIAFIKQQPVFKNLSDKLRFESGKLTNSELICLIFFSNDPADLFKLQQLNLSEVDLVANLNLSEINKKALELTLNIQLKLIAITIFPMTGINPKRPVCVLNQEVWHLIQSAQFYYAQKNVSFAKFLNFSSKIFLKFQLNPGLQKNIGWNLDGINLSDSLLESCNLEYISLIGAYLKGIEIQNSEFNYANISYANIEQASIGACSLFNLSALAELDFNNAQRIKKRLDTFMPLLKNNPSLPAIVITDFYSFFTTATKEFRTGITPDNLKALQQAIDHPFFACKKQYQKSINSATQRLFHRTIVMTSEQTQLIELKAGLLSAQPQLSDNNNVDNSNYRRFSSRT